MLSDDTHFVARMNTYSINNTVRLHHKIYSLPLVAVLHDYMGVLFIMDWHRLCGYRHFTLFIMWVQFTFYSILWLT